jgi:hypothetical protein
MFGRVARTRFVNGIGSANLPFRSFLHFQKECRIAVGTPALGALGTFVARLLR